MHDKKKSELSLFYRLLLLVITIAVFLLLEDFLEISTRARFYRIGFYFISFALFVLEIIVFVKRFIDWLDSFILKNETPAVIVGSTVVIVVTLATSFWPTEIRDNSWNYLYYWYSIFAEADAKKYNPDFWITLFWIVQISYIIFLVRLVHNQEKIRDQKRKANEKFVENIRDEVTSVILNAPNRNIFELSTRILSQIYDDLQRLEELLKDAKNDGSKIQHYHTYFQSILTSMCSITYWFLNAKNEKFTANIMLYIPKDKKRSKYVVELMADKDACIYFKNIPQDKLLGILHTNENLSVVFKQDEIKCSSVTLPVLIDAKENEIFPGAPRAAQEGQAVVQTTDIDIDEAFTQLSDIAKEEARTFFKSEKGKHIKSIVSLRIPVFGESLENLQDKQIPVFQGVINIDSANTYLLGYDENSAFTYYEIMKPIVYMLAPYLHHYFTIKYPE